MWAEKHMGEKQRKQRREQRGPIGEANIQTAGVQKEPAEGRRARGRQFPEPHISGEELLPRLGLHGNSASQVFRTMGTENPEASRQESVQGGS